MECVCLVLILRMVCFAVEFLALLTRTAHQAHATKDSAHLATSILEECIVMG